ncbi:MAG TPA: reverse transcriptase family protein [Lacipirellulaceae bacterium]|nr:reverse transcriptase family protein [Lacipirellulaceae bacterium]
MSIRESVAQILARAFVDARWDREALLERCDSVFGKTPRWCGPFVDRLLTHFPISPPSERLVSVIRADEGFGRARLGRSVSYWATTSMGQMRPALPVQIEIPSLCTTRELAEWFGITISELDWFADLKAFSGKRSAEKLLHYRYRMLAKRFGAVRLIEAPKPRLMAIQRQVLRRILDHVPPHDAAHGFRAGRSIVTFAAPHVGQAVVARLDLKDFFPTVTLARVAALFRAIGYPHPVAKLLAGLCTSVAPTHTWENCEPPHTREQLQTVRSLYGVPHLPQGSPTSPAIANLCAYRLDCRLTGLARSAGANYSRYADDLAFSGDAEFARHAKRFMVHVAATVAEEGFVVHHHKTRIMRDGVCQHLAGVVVNRRTNLRRSDYDRLKAILVNCRRHGALDQNRLLHPDFRAHLRGRVAFVAQLHPQRGQRLLELFNGINW